MAENPPGRRQYTAIYAGASAGARLLYRNVDAESCTKEVSLLVEEILLRPNALTPSRISDLYLLALAAANSARLATFDTRIPAEAVAGGTAAIEIIRVL